MTHNELNLPKGQMVYENRSSIVGAHSRPSESAAYRYVRDTPADAINYTYLRHLRMSATGTKRKAAVSSTGRTPCSPPPYELACRMLNAIGWDGTNFRLRDPVALAIAPEVERINRRANAESQPSAGRR